VGTESAGEDDMNDGSVARTGIPGLDDVLGGGWPAGHLYLVLGHPGTGKSTMGLKFLLEGVRQGETVLYVTLSETADEVRGMAASHGWSLEGIHLYELTAAQQVMGLNEEPTMFDPSDVEFRETSRSILEQIERLRPQRVVFDSLSELSLLARDPLAFRREVLLLKQALIEQHTTALLLSDRTTPDTDRQLQSLTHGVLTMEELSPEFGGERRRLRVTKLRATAYRGGYHDFRIERGGLVVYPRLVSAEHGRPFSTKAISSGIANLDALLGGGLDPGSTTLLMGPSGSGKSSIMAQFAVASLASGSKATLFLFDERVESFVHRAEAFGQPVAKLIEEGSMHVRQVDPAELSPGEFAHLIRSAVEAGSEFIAVDSLNGYLHAMAEERFVVLQLHELISYLNGQGVTTMLLLAQHGLVNATDAPLDITYIADAVVLTRYFEHAGKFRRALSVLKKRRGEHEDWIREFRIAPEGIVVGEPLREFQGLFTGTPVFEGDKGTLLKDLARD
jgi:circadian clock protein KaiC